MLMKALSENAPAEETLKNEDLTLKPFAVAVIQLD